MVITSPLAHPRDERIKFVDGTHTYFIDGSSDEWISTTTLIHTLFPSFDADEVIQKMMKGRNWPQSPYFGKTPQQIKDGWEANSTQASSAGTKMHNNIENYYNNREHETESKEWQLFRMFEDDHANMKPLRSEMVVFAEKEKIAGSIDMIYQDSEDKSAVLLYDWKRSKAIKMGNQYETGTHEITQDLEDCNYITYSLQLAIYKKILVEYYGMKVNGCFLVILHPAQDTYLKLKTMDVDDIVDKIFELRRKRLGGVEHVVKRMKLDH